MARGSVLLTFLMSTDFSDYPNTNQVRLDTDPEMRRRWALVQTKDEEGAATTSHPLVLSLVMPHMVLVQSPYRRH